MVEFKNDSQLHPDVSEAFENMQNYLSEKLGIARSWHENLQNPPSTLSSWVQLALHNESPFSGAILFDRIEEAKINTAAKPFKEQHKVVDGLWHEIYEQVNSD
ncbi:MAG: hypothetical protein AABX51_00500 [Nanoarchaeota archaeon]